jgi:hypothetical protein
MTRVGIRQTGQMIDASALDLGPATMAPDALHRSPCIFTLLTGLAPKRIRI